MWLVTLELTPPWSRQSRPCTLQPTRPCSFISQAHPHAPWFRGASPLPSLRLRRRPASRNALCSWPSHYCPPSSALCTPGTHGSRSLPGPRELSLSVLLIWGWNLSDLSFYAQICGQAAGLWVVAFNGCVVRCGLYHRKAISNHKAVPASHALCGDQFHVCLPW